MKTVVKRLLKTIGAILTFPFKLIYLLLKWLFKTAKKIGEKILKFLDFRQFKPKKRVHFFINIVIGIAIVLFMHLVESTQWGENVLNSAFDVFIRIDAHKAVKNIVDTEEEGILIVDLDHNKKPGPNTLENPLLSPRDQIARVIDTARNGGGKVVVLDIFLENKDCCFPDKDNALREALTRFPTAGDFKTKVIFAVSKENKKELKKNLLDALIDNNPNFYRAIPTLYASQTDALVRYWKTYDTSEKQGKKQIIWSIPVLTSALYGNTYKKLKTMGKQLTRQPQASGPGFCELQLGKDQKVRGSLHHMDLLRQRIRFLLFPKDCMTDYPAGNLILPTPETLKPQRCKDKIVIIGSSDPLKGDRHLTPIGRMPGMYIQANSIYTLLKKKQLEPASLWIALGIDFLIILLAAYLFHYLHSFIAKLSGTLLVIALFGLIAYCYFFQSHGIFLNFVFGIAGIGYLETIYTLREIITNGITGEPG
jgi:CHASE2 domain-containing sensor protein